MEKIYIFDTTLRDGEQSPGASMSINQKCEIALQLENLNVDTIEAGFPISSPHQFEACTRIAELLKKTTIAVLARTTKHDIDAAAQAIQKAQHSRIHLFISSSPIHMKYKLKKKPEEVLEIVNFFVRYARNLVAEVEFSPEDATRTEPEFLVKIIETAIQAGASVINIPDTVGYMVPQEYFQLIQYIKTNAKGIDNTIISTHCHDDLGLAVANTLSAIRAGARQAELTLNGIGERAGNAALEEVVMTLYVKKEFFQCTTNIISEHLYPTCRLLASTIGFPIARNKAIIGENAFSHESGIHQHGMLKNRLTYEIITPSSVGREESKLVLGRHSGKHGFRHKLQVLGITLNDAQLETAFQQFLNLADQKKEIYDEDIFSIISTQFGSDVDLYQLADYHVESSKKGHPLATVKIRKGETLMEGTGKGDGSISSILHAIEQAIGISPTLVEFSVNSTTPGTQALGEVSILISIDKKQSKGRGSSTDVIEASAIAYLNAISHNILLEEVTHP